MGPRAKEAFDVLSGELDACKRDRDDSGARTLALSMGFQDRENPDRYVLSDCAYTDAEGSTVTLTQRWHDPSGPFQNLPDIHRVRLTFKAAGGWPVERMVEWEE